MTTSRRDFLRSLGGASAAGMVAPWAVSGESRAVPFEPPRLQQNGAFIRLNSNENAYGPSMKVVEAMKAAVAGANRYPRPTYGMLTDAIARLHHVGTDQIVLGCGSTDILRMAAFAFLGNGKQLLQASPTFEAIEHYGRAAGAEVVSVGLTPDFSHDLDGMLARAGTATALVYICNPNNPTASLTARKELEAFLAKLPAGVFVVIDEAYHHFAGQSGRYASFLDRPLHDERVVVTRTFSKVYGLAGLRLGYAVAAPKVAQRMRALAGQDNVNAIATQAALAALEDSDGLNAAIQRNMDDRQEFFNQALARMMKPIDSHANFVMMNTFHPAAGAVEHFRQNNILVGRVFPAMDTYIRVSLGLPDEMRAFWHAWDALPFAKEMMMPH